MSATPVPLSVLDLSPLVSGGTAAEALRNTIDLARHAEQAGYLRYWLAEHHLTRGVAGSAPAVLIGLVAAATSRIRVGSGAVLLGHQTPLSVVEQFGVIDALHPGRIDLGLGRSGQRRAEALKELAEGEVPLVPAARVDSRAVDGLLIPAPFSFAHLLCSPKFAVLGRLLQQPGAQSPDFAEQVDELLALFAGTARPDGVEVHASPGEGADVQVRRSGPFVPTPGRRLVTAVGRHPARAGDLRPDPR